MNIFILDKCPKKAATYYVDIHVGKIITEIAQMLANCYTLEELEKAPKTVSGFTRKYSYFNHPVSKWIRAGRENFLWTIEHANALIDENKYRFGRSRNDDYFIKWCTQFFPSLPDGKTKFALAMPDEYKVDCPVESYRDYYRIAKKFNVAGKLMHKWTKREKPEWM